jgi:hypothetical protein
VLLFSGHMVDRPDRKKPRLPAAAVPPAARAIELSLNELDVDHRDRAVCSAASGGDLLFIESCLARGAAIDVFLPFARERFLETSVRPGGAGWESRFDTLLSDPRVTLHLGADANADGQAYARCNQSMLDFSLARGEELDFICLWDGGGGDGPGGTEYMVRAVEQRGGRVHWIDTRTLR